MKLHEKLAIMAAQFSEAIRYNPFKLSEAEANKYDGSRPNRLSQKGRRKRAKWVNKK